MILYTAEEVVEFIAASSLKGTEGESEMLEKFDKYRENMLAESRAFGYKVTKGKTSDVLVDAMMRGIHEELVKLVPSYWPRAAPRRSFYAIVWCPDCNGVDPGGCFDGDVKKLGPFNSHEEADEAAKKEVEHTNWAFEIKEEEVK